MKNKPRSSFSNKTLLVIVPHFLAFIHDPVIEQTKYFSNIYVIVLHPMTKTLVKPKESNQEMTLLNRKTIDFSDVPKNLHIFDCPYLALPGKRFLFLRGYFSYYFVRKLIKKQNIQFDIIHSHLLWPMGFVGAKLKKKYNKPNIITGHGHDVYQLPFQSSRWFNTTKKILSNSNIIITVSEKNKKILSKITDNEVYVVPNGFDDSKFNSNNTISKKELELPDDRKIILTIGNLEKPKGHTYLIGSIEKLVQEHPHILCLIIGGGRDYLSIRKIIDEKNLSKNIRLLGSKEHSEIPLWLNVCDLFVLPSLSEGMPTVMFEALGLGKPVIATDVGGISEIITSKDYGTVVPPGDVVALTEALNAGLGKKWDDASIKKYSQNFTWKQIVSNIIEVYKKLQHP